MRIHLQPLVLSILTSLCASTLVACDDDLVVRNIEAPTASEEPGCSSDHEPHPYLSCDPESSDNPACVLGCGTISGSGPELTEGYKLCGIPCDTALDCQPWAGESVAVCEGRCHFECDESNPCPEGLECVSDSSQPAECLAPYSEPNP